MAYPLISGIEKMAATKCHPDGRLLVKSSTDVFGQSIDAIGQLVEERPRRQLVNSELGYKRIYRREERIGPQSLQYVDTNLLPVQVPGKVEDVGLDLTRAGVHAWSGADVGHRLSRRRLASEQRAGGIDAIGEGDLITRREDIRSRISDRASEMRPLDDLAADSERATK